LCTLKPKNLKNLKKPKKPKNLKNFPKNLGFFQPGYVTVCEIFSDKEWRDVENQVRGR